jgi:hypothetical protein
VAAAARVEEQKKTDMKRKKKNESCADLSKPVDEFCLYGGTWREGWRMPFSLTRASHKKSGSRLFPSLPPSLPTDWRVMRVYTSTSKEELHVVMSCCWLDLDRTHPTSRASEALVFFFF